MSVRLPLLATLLLAACAAPAERAAARLDPRVADWGALRVFVALPAGIAPDAGYPRLDVEARVAGGAPLGASAPLVAVADPRAPRGATAYAVPVSAHAALEAVTRFVAGAAAPGSARAAVAVETCRSGAVADGAGLAISVAGPSDARPLPLARPDGVPDPAVRAHLAAKRPCG